MWAYGLAPWAIPDPCAWAWFYFLFFKMSEWHVVCLFLKKMHRWHISHWDRQCVICKRGFQPLLWRLKNQDNIFPKKNSVFKSFQHENTLLALLEYPQTNLTTKNYLKKSKKSKSNQLGFDSLDLDLFFKQYWDSK
jgi:hypothetical protein